jgi:hypothetical protein
VFSDFNQKLSEFSNVVSNMKVTIEGNQTVTVNLNGAEVLAKIVPEVRSMVAEQVKSEIAVAFDRNNFNSNPV